MHCIWSSCSCFHGYMFHFKWYKCVKHISSRSLVSHHILRPVVLLKLAPLFSLSYHKFTISYLLAVQLNNLQWSKLLVFLSDAKKQIQQFASDTIASRFSSTLQSAFSVVWLSKQSESCIIGNTEMQWRFVHDYFRRHLIAWLPIKLA